MKHNNTETRKTIVKIEFTTGEECELSKDLNKLLELKNPKQTPLK